MPCLALCFSVDTFVTTKQGDKRISELKFRDELLSSQKSGKGKWTEFYTYVHKEDTIEADFIVLNFSNGKELKVTGDHLVYIRSKEDGEKIATLAINVKEGDEMYHLDNVTSLITPIPVTRKRMMKQMGVYAPLTFSGNFLANGFLVSCYGDIETVGVAHAAFAPLRTWYKIVKPKKDENIHGVHGYAEALIKFRDIVRLPIK